jgi:D-alanyl-D-alanine carboxypeptidase (penicillin-binding protein 5/6)
MINTILSLYVAGILSFTGNPVASMDIMPWNGGTALTASAIPQKNQSQIAPVIKAKAAIAVDLNNGLVLYEKNIYEPLPIASLTKLMTAIIILEDSNINDTVTISKNVTKTEGSKIWLAQGEKITVESLLYSILIPSANDAAVALAEYKSGSSEEFAKVMNSKAKELGLLSTIFVNPTGLDEPQTAEEKIKQEKESAKTKGEKTQLIYSMPDLFFGKMTTSDAPNKNISTAYDLALLSRYAYGKSFVRRAAIKEEMEVTSIDSRQKHKLKNTNELLGSYLKVLGLKTGTTEEAGECLITIIEDDKGNKVLTVVLNSPERYTETKLLADWVFKAYQWN